MLVNVASFEIGGGDVTLGFVTLAFFFGVGLGVSGALAWERSDR